MRRDRRRAVPRRVDPLDRPRCILDAKLGERDPQERG